MELQEGALRASVSAFGDEAALAAVTAPHRALDMPRDIPRRENRRSKLPIRPGADSARPRLRGCPELGFLHLLEEQGERAVEDRAWVAVRDLAAEKGLNAPQLVVALLADRELDAIALRRWSRRSDDAP